MDKKHHGATQNPEDMGSRRAARRHLYIEDLKPFRNKLSSLISYTFVIK